MTSHFAAVDTSDLSIAYFYDANAVIMHPVGNNYVHCPVPTDIPRDCLRAINNDGNFALVEDPDKRTAFEQMMTERKWSRMRKERDGRLTETDWTQLPDNTLTEEKRQAFAVYRQELRDLPQTITNIDQVIWPVAP